MVIEFRSTLPILDKKNSPEDKELHILNPSGPLLKVIPIDINLSLSCRELR